MCLASYSNLMELLKRLFNNFCLSFLFKIEMIPSNIFNLRLFQFEMVKNLMIAQLIHIFGNLSKIF